jgi:hypothetical protein
VPEELEEWVAQELAVTAWRRKLLLTAGFDREMAGVLADRRADLHALLALVDRGCPPHLAARILAPLDPPAARCSAPERSSGRPGA